jgi:hypothetical protein
MRSLRIALLATTLLLATTTNARLMQAPSYQELVEKSDLVVIAAPTAARDSNEQIDLPGIAVTTSENRATGLAVVGVETTFRVSAVLKGDKGLKQFVLHHYREAKPQPTINGPALVAFDSSKKTSFLLFLVREADGRYAPTGGQTDPGFFSVHALGPFVR